MSIKQVAEAFKSTLDGAADIQVYDYVPDSQNIPCVVVYPLTTEISIPITTTWILWCIAGRIEEQGAQRTLSDWLSDDGLIVAALLDDTTLGGQVNSLNLQRIQNWRPGPIAQGRPSHWHAELVCEVFT